MAKTIVGCAELANGFVATGPYFVQGMQAWLAAGLDRANTSRPTCTCPDCATGKIPASGCSLPAHEYTEAGGTRCWNCGAADGSPFASTKRAS